MNNMPLFCEVCNLSLDYFLDYNYFQRFKCCRNCSMKWAEYQSDKWLSGWRPSPEEVDKYKQERISIARAARRNKNDI